MLMVIHLDILQVNNLVHAMGPSAFASYVEYLLELLEEEIEKADNTLMEFQK
jgi:hypothetical protein